jgi:hypothetical protein
MATVFPGDGQTNVPTQWGQREGPDPLPQDAHRPSGYPISIQDDAGTLRVDFAELRDLRGAMVPTYPNSARVQRVQLLHPDSGRTTGTPSNLGRAHSRGGGRYAVRSHVVVRDRRPPCHQIHSTPSIKWAVHRLRRRASVAAAEAVMHVADHLRRQRSGAGKNGSALGDRHWRLICR